MKTWLRCFLVQLIVIQVTMASGNSGDTIVVLPGTGIYREGSRDACGKGLTIKIAAPGTIR